jgi:hypothetical protein
MRRLALVVVLLLCSCRKAADDPRIALQTLREALTTRDEGIITRLYGRDAYRTSDTNRLLWDWIERDVMIAGAVLDHPVRTIVDTRGVVVLGWNGGALYASTYRRHDGELVLASNDFGLKEQSPEGHAAIETLIRKQTDEQLREAFFTDTTQRRDELREQIIVASFTGFFRKKAATTPREETRTTTPVPRRSETTMTSAGREEPTPRAVPVAAAARVATAPMMVATDTTTDTITTGTDGIADRERERFFDHLARARAGDAHSMGITGWSLIQGWGTVKNCTEGLIWLRKAADAGDTFASRELRVETYRKACP